jgi:hypothetical protein
LVIYEGHNPLGFLEHQTSSLKTNECPLLIKQKIRTNADYADIGTICEQKQLLNNNRNYSIQTFLQGLTPTASTDYSLWKAIKKTKEITKSPPPLRTTQGTWARSDIEKANTFAEHLANLFQIHR